MKCPLCDGTVVNGRCRDCGMPYRSDELLYHLNEDRKAHEKHATEKAREELQKRMVPLGDTGKGTSGSTASKNTKKTSQNTVWKNTGKDISPSSVKRVKEKQKAVSRSKKEFGRSNNSSWSSEKKPKKKKSLASIVFWILIILSVAGPFVEDFVANLRARKVYNEYLKSESYSDNLEEVDPDEVNEQEIETYGFSSWSGSNGKMEYGLSVGYGSIEVGEELPAGIYEIYTNSDEITLICEKSDTGEEKIWNLWDGETITQPLKKGDVLELMQDEDSYKSVYFKEVDE